jgi:hypothetical protein
MHMWFVEALNHVIASKGEANPRPEPRDTSAREPAVCGVKHSHSSWRPRTKMCLAVYECELLTVLREIKVIVMSLLMLHSSPIYLRQRLHQ